MNAPVDAFATLPDPAQAGGLDDLVERLRRLKVWAGNPSYEVIKDRVNAAWTAAGRPAAELARRSTVANCFRPGRRRLNTDLVIAVVRALHPDAGYVNQWRQALRVLGASSVAQLEANVASLGNTAFTPDELAEIDKYATESGINLWARSSAQ